MLLRTFIPEPLLVSGGQQKRNNAIITRTQNQVSEVLIMHITSYELALTVSHTFQVY